MVTKVLEIAVATPNPNPEVTESELALIKQLCLPNKVICQNFGVSSNAIDMRIRRLTIRFGVENRTAIVVKASQLGLITIDQLVYRSYGKENLS